MRNVMALAACREALVHAVSMRLTMAISTFRHRHVLVGVACCTGNLAMLGRAGCEGRID